MHFDYTRIHHRESQKFNLSISPSQIRCIPDIRFHCILLLYVYGQGDGESYSVDNDFDPLILLVISSHLIIYPNTAVYFASPP